MAAVATSVASLTRDLVNIDSTTGRGKSLIVVTHNEDVADRCSRVVHLRDGLVVGQVVQA